jgi:hypothetical protein
LVDPQILVLDEATSAVDVQTEREIQRALDNVVAGRTTIAIAHRLSTLAKADLLLVLKDGKVVETGSHAELMARDGEYARLQRAQRATQPLVETEVVEAPEEPGVLGLPAISQLTLRWSVETDSLSLESPSGPVGVVARRCFPLTDAARFISLIDARGHELVCLENPGELPSASREALESALAASELLPRVERIESMREEATQSTWRVVTDRGPRDFVVEQEDHIRRLADGRHLITDRHGMRYLLPRLEQLDAASRKLFSPFS